MNIVHICNYFQPILGYQEYFLAKEQNKLGHNVVVITSDRFLPFPDYKNTVMKILGPRKVGTGTFIERGVTVCRLPILFEFSRRVWLIGFEKKIIESKPDLIICHNLLHFLTIRLLLIRKKILCRIIFDDHTTPNQIRPGFFSEVVYFFFRKLVIPVIKKERFRVIGISNSCEEVLIKKYGLGMDGFEIVPLGTDLEVFYQSFELRNSCRRLLNIKDEIVIIHTGKINSTKKSHLIIQAIDSLPISDKGVISIFIGGIAEEYSKIFTSYADNAKHRVIVMNPIKPMELNKYYNCADIAIWPVDTTISTLDASSCGCAIICSDLMSERYKNGNGYGIKDGDLLQLSECINELISNPSLLETMQYNSIELVKREFEWSKITQHFL